MNVKIVEQDGKQYLVIGDRAFPILRMEEGKPVMDMSESWSEQKPNDRGGTDCIVHVPYLQLGVKAQPPGSGEEN